MNLPEIKSYEEQAKDTVVSVINRARECLGDRQTLKELAATRKGFKDKAKVSLIDLKAPLAITAQKLIEETIEKKWKLTPTVLYYLKYIGITQNESSLFYYFEAIFSQPTISYPIPQATVSVFFRVEEKQIEPAEIRGVPMMVFRIEGHNTEHDVRFVTLTADWILAVIQMKIKLFQRIENYTLF